GVADDQGEVQKRRREQGRGQAAGPGAARGALGPGRRGRAPRRRGDHGHERTRLLLGDRRGELLLHVGEGRVDGRRAAQRRRGALLDGGGGVAVVHHYRPGCRRGQGLLQRVQVRELLAQRRVVVEVGVRRGRRGDLQVGAGVLLVGEELDEVERGRLVLGELA